MRQATFTIMPCLQTVSSRQFLVLPNDSLTQLVHCLLSAQLQDS